MTKNLGAVREWMLGTMVGNKWGIKQSVPLYPDNLPTPEVVDQSCPKIPEMKDTQQDKQPLHTAAHNESNWRGGMRKKDIIAKY